jgi:GNAT superfamily N-acetyltransferase
MCDCAKNFEVKLARAGDYKMFKQILDRGRHPAFIGLDTMQKNAENGGALFYSHGGAPVAVSLINPHLGILLALNVIPAHRSHGLGRAIMKFLMPNFARVIESKVPWFESQGYRKIGSLKKGQALNTQIMARGALFTLAGKLQKVWQ